MNIKDLKTAREELEAKFTPKEIVAGFDGFVDEIIHIVDKYLDSENYQRIETINDFAGKIAQASGLSTNFEYKTMQKKLGGNGPIIGNALLSQGNSLHYIGALGSGTIDPLFQEFAAKCKSVLTLGDPGYTEALEFSDGKIMMGKVESLDAVNWDNILKHYSQEKIIDLLNNSDLLCCTNWTNLYKLNSILIGINNLDISKKLPLFIDLADPRKRTDKDIIEVLALISLLEKKFEVIFGLNEKESIHIAKMLKIECADTKERSSRIRSELEISCVVIHPVKFAVASTKDETAYAEGPYCEKPKLSTGAGDNFNAGFCNGLINGLSLKSALYTGTCTSGYYVRNMQSPSRQELLQFMHDWEEKKI
ncbi:MAG: PfkB family carbohydrate kinase [Candidatus Zophobacter franzmannii]|nr:PfkB family carbohydrate kinase [Candidatus Zophobacter franzmannii]